MNKKYLTLSSAAIAAAIALAGCAPGTGSGSSGTSTPGMDHGSSPASGPSTDAPSTSAPAAAEHNAADVAFAQMMIPHHAQAVEMSDMMLKKQNVPGEVTALATKIKAAQGPEIETMTGWLKGWNEPTQMPSGHSGHGMEGMMSDEDMKKLDAAQGTEAAKLFLNQMIAHHAGAIVMAKAEMTGGKNADAIQLSKEIVSAQEAEIEEMRKLLAAL